MKVNYFSVKGKRKENEDYVLSKLIGKNSSIHLIADGMGGYEDGSLAAETVAKSIFDNLQSSINSDNKIELINESIVKANNIIQRISLERARKLGCTIGGCLLYDKKATLFWVGDVKIIHVRGGEIHFESEDHSLINQLKKNGNIDNSIDFGSIRHIVTRSINGDESNFSPEILEFEMAPDDKIIICSDGILEIVRLLEIAKTNFNSKVELDFFKSKYENSSDNSSLIAIEF